MYIYIYKNFKHSANEDSDHLHTPLLKVQCRKGERGRGDDVTEYNRNADLGSLTARGSGGLKEERK